MYEKYWNLKEKPFKNTPDPDYLYCSREHEEAIARMMYTIDEDMGGAVLTGVFGCGKTVISQVLCVRLSSDKYQVAYINNPQLDYIDLLRAIVRKLKPVELSSNKRELSTDALLEHLENILVNNANDGKKTVVIIDEAHIIKDENIFESLRLLLNFQLKDRFLLSLLLFGQPELKQSIQNNKQFEQRLAVKCNIGPFDQENTSAYVLHRLSRSQNRERVIFTTDALKTIFDYSHGIPRRINRICDLSLLVGCGSQLDSIDSNVVLEAVNMMGY